MAPETRLSKTRFLHSVVWGWLGVVVNIVIAIVLSPIIVRKLGVERYGLWVLLFSTIEYLRMLDLGFRAAIVNAAARLRARQDWNAVNRTLVTTILYFAAIGAGCCIAAVALRDIGVEFFRIPLALRSDARTLIPLIALTVSLRLVFTPLPATLEAFQRFDLVNRAYISALVFRATGSIAVLILGYGLIEMAYVVLAAQIGECFWNFLSAKKTLPLFRMSPELVQLNSLSTLFGFARHSAVMSAANLATLQCPTSILGYLSGPTPVGFFALPYRLVMYIAEAVAKVSDVTASVTASLDETHDRERVWNLAIMTNRHCFALFLPVAVFLAFYGTALLRLWISPEVAAVSGPLIPVLLFGFLFGFAGQYNAGGILLGQGKHALYAYGIVAEVIVSVAALFLLVPRYGALGTAWVVSMIGSIRGAYLAIGLCWLNAFPFWRYVTAVYSRPLLTAFPVIIAAFALRASIWPGRTWFELIAAGSVICVAYFGIAFFTVLDEGDRLKLLQGLALRLHGKRRAAA